MAIAILSLVTVTNSILQPRHAKSSRYISDVVWFDVEESNLVLSGPRILIPNQYRPLFVGFEDLSFHLNSAPLEFSRLVEKNERLLTLPFPNGRNERYRIFNSPVMDPTLAAKFPSISTYSAIGVDDKHAYGRLDLTSTGFHAMLVTSQGAFFY